MVKPGININSAKGRNAPLGLPSPYAAPSFGPSIKQLQSNPATRTTIPSGVSPSQYAYDQMRAQASAASANYSRSNLGVLGDAYQQGYIPYSVYEQQMGNVSGLDPRGLADSLAEHGYFVDPREMNAPSRSGAQWWAPAGGKEVVRFGDSPAYQSPYNYKNQSLANRLGVPWTASPSHADFDPVTGEVVSVQDLLKQNPNWTVEEAQKYRSNVYAVKAKSDTPTLVSGGAESSGIGPNSFAAYYDPRFGGG